MLREELKKIAHKPTLFITKRYPDINSILNEYFIEKDFTIYGSTLSFKQKLYCYIEQLTAADIPKCPTCKTKLLEMTGSQGTYRLYCSAKCRANSSENEAKKKKTCLQKYGVENVSQSNEIKDKKKDTMMERYGESCPFTAFADKIKETLMLNYGVTNPSYSFIIKHRISLSNKQINALHGDEIRQKRIQTFQKRYGEHITNSFCFVKNRRESKIEIKLREKLKGEKLVIKYREFDIFLRDKNMLIEVDGENYHPQCLKDIRFYQVVHAVNDIRKERSIADYDYEFYRIGTITLRKFLDKESDREKLIDLIIKNSYKPNREIINLSDIVSIDEIKRVYSKVNYKVFNGHIYKLRELIQLLKGLVFKNNQVFLKEVYNFDLHNNTDIDFELLRNQVNELRYSSFLLTPEFCKVFIKEKGMEIFEQSLDHIITSFRSRIPRFLYPDTTETLELIRVRLNKLLPSKIFKGNVIQNNCSITGNIYLKSIFKSFFHSSYGSNLTPVEIFNSDKLLKKIIKYRIGINNTNEIYGLSMKTVIKGISAIRGTISFFKPAVAYSIYKRFLSTNTPTVLDPCMGFGGRMLGFFMAYPKGTYIGCEPNVETFEELKTLKNNLSEFLGYEINCHLYNQTIEKFSTNNLGNYKDNIELTFTSIPYYDLERYSQDIVTTQYKDFEDWKDKFVKCIFSLPNCLINLPIDLYDKCPELHEKVKDFYYLENSVAKHFNKKDKKKQEYIIKCF